MPPIGPHTRSSSRNIEEDDGRARLGPQQGGRTSSVSKLAGLKAAWIKAAPERFISPKQIADEIRHFLRHDESSVYQRHWNFHHEDSAEPSPIIDELVPLVSRLIDLADYKGKDKEKRCAAESELLKLFAADPVVYEHFLYCRNVTPYRFGTFVIPDEMENTEQEIQEIHNRWSVLLGRNTFKTGIREESAQIEYLPYAMGLEMQNDDLVFLHQLWERFLDHVIEQHNAFYCVNNVDLCFKNILSSGKPLAYLASPSQLERIAMFLIVRSTEMDFVLSTFFPPPNFTSYQDVSRDPEDPYGTKLSISSPARTWDIVTASTYALTFERAYVKEEITKHFTPPYGKVFNTLVEFIKGGYGRGTPLERTVLAKGNGKFIDLYTTVNDAALTYRRTKGTRGLPSHHMYSSLVSLVRISVMAIVTENSSREEEKKSDVSRSNFFVAHTADIDRYHKQAMLWMFHDNDDFISVLNDRVRSQTFYTDPEGICSLTYIPQFQNVSFLRRFKIGSKYYITADGLPGYDTDFHYLWKWEFSLGNVVVDKMLLDGQILTCLRVDRELPKFFCTGHYPILAGVDFKTGKELYIAAVRREVDSAWYFSTISNGASSVTYTDEVGEEHMARTFFVLALRHDPTDLPPQDVRRRVGAKDPTGPIFWAEFWPLKDTNCFYDDRSRDDRLLESFLNDMHQRNIRENIFKGLY
ncbi:hypothetical protein SCHPADRAFT_943344 [Schizopora paradoxa]|uniref:Uncharacterized protein n=1 Tax=Schizopora paradoxa TaxID=27342 RepID=A0A0H2RK18_9AGAM|nr:hypothetical protein SCHPADRAFT_943344 [Schizopora paradoxa]